MNVPFSTTNYTSELIENQQALTIADVVMNDASVRTLQARGGYGDDFQVRGFSLSMRDVSVNGLYGLSPSTRLPLEVIERVEVLKGPGSLTNGVGPSGSIGGSINVVTKRAGDRKSTRLNSSHLVISYAVFCLKKKKRESRCSLFATEVRAPYAVESHPPP